MNKVSFVDSIKSVFVNWNKFKGVATRREYWFFVLFTILIGIVFSTIESVIWPPVETADLIDAINQPTPITSAMALILLIPTLSVTSRRLQDAGWSGKWLFLYLAPLIPLALGVFGVISYLESAVVPEVEALAVSVAYFVPTLLLTFAIQVFLLVLCLLPSKPKEAGNKYSPEA
jgi:uncharacterized membrane protein YhaH (DUF805 family)